MILENKSAVPVVLGFETIVDAPVGKQGALSARLAGDGCEEGGGECNNGCECYCDCYACDVAPGDETRQATKRVADTLSNDRNSPTSAERGVGKR